MKKILITGGSGTIGSAFIKEYREQYSFAILSRNESLQHALKSSFPEVSTNICNIVDFCDYQRVIEKESPDIVIHAAAIKHVDMAEKQPIQVINTNIIGSLNVIETSKILGIPITIGISTDKACDHSNIYGMTKYMMEKCFLEANTNKHAVAVCRFGNVTFSNGSVLPYWLNLKSQNKPLKVTDPNMNRMMFSQKEAAELIFKSISICQNEGGGFILSKQMKSVNMMTLARKISDKIEIVGIRPGENLDEDLISDKEVPYTKILEDKYIRINKEKNTSLETAISVPYNTKTAIQMNDKDIEDLIKMPYL